MQVTKRWAGAQLGQFLASPDAIRDILSFRMVHGFSLGVDNARVRYLGVSNSAGKDLQSGIHLQRIQHFLFRIDACVRRIKTEQLGRRHIRGEESYRTILGLEERPQKNAHAFPLLSSIVATHRCTVPDSSSTSTFQV